MSGTLAKGHVRGLVVVLVVCIKAMGIVIIGIGEVVGVAMNAKEGNQNGRVLLDGVVGAGHGEVLSALAIQERQAGIFAYGFCSARDRGCILYRSYS